LAKVKRVKKRKLNIKALIILLLIIYIIVMFFYTIFTSPIKNIYIKNTALLKDNEIIEVAGIKNYPSWFKINNKKLEKKIKSLELVESVKVKKTLTGKLIINIKEAVPLFYNRNTDKVVLSNNKEVENNKYLGIPTLINYVPNDLLTKFINKFSLINSDIINMINEIEYNPDIQKNETTGESIVIDSERFLLRMNDTNIVYVNIINMERLNDYKEIFASIGDERGVLLLDSYVEDNDLLGIFSAFEDTGESGSNGEN